MQYRAVFGPVNLFSLANDICIAIIMSRSASQEAEVRSWGFSHVFTWTDGP